jgi:exosome complex RNA-binding protein Rrp4
MSIIINRLLYKENGTLRKLSAFYEFEIAIGFNGRIWVKSANMKDTIEISKAIIECKDLSTLSGVLTHISTNKKSQ